MTDPAVAAPAGWRLPGGLHLAIAFGLLCVANGRWILAPAAWLAPFVLLLYVDSRPAARGLGLAGLAQLLAYFVCWRGIIPVPGLWYYLAAGVYALVYFVPVVLHRLMTPRMAGFGATLVLPCSLVAVEFLFQRLATPYGSWGSPAYTQTSFTPLLQLVSVTGVPGVHFLLAWLASTAAWVWRTRRDRGGVKPVVATCAGVLMVVYDFAL